MTTRTKIALSIVLIFLIGAIGVFAFNHNFSQSSQSSYSAPVSSATSTTASSTTSYTLAQVATHKDATSCWAAINGNVYDVTSWISQHPGGPEHILSICGTDASSVFNLQHGGESRPADELKTFYIGTLSN